MSVDHESNKAARILNDEITEEALGQVVGGSVGGAGAEPAPAPAPTPTPKCKPGDPSCTDATKPWGEW